MLLVFGVVALAVGVGLFLSVMWYILTDTKARVYLEERRVLRASCDLVRVWERGEEKLRAESRLTQCVKSYEAARRNDHEKTLAERARHA